MSRALISLLFAMIMLSECGTLRDVSLPEVASLPGMEGLVNSCYGSDTINSILIKKAEAILTYDKERYEVSVSLYSKKDSIIYLSAVNSGYEILRASVMQDSIMVIDRMNKIVYSAPLNRKFGYQYPVSFHDLQNLIASHYLCDDLQMATDDHQNTILFEFDESNIKKRISLNRFDHQMNIFEFYHQKTDRYLMGERLEDAFKIYSNFMITEIELIARGGERTINKELKIKMDVNPRKYTFTELR